MSRWLRDNGTASNLSEGGLSMGTAKNRSHDMTAEAEFILAELPDVAKIVADECWLEGERQGRPVDPSDTTVQTRVAEVILSGAGARIRRLHDGKGNGFFATFGGWKG